MAAANHHQCIDMPNAQLDDLGQDQDPSMGHETNPRHARCAESSPPLEHHSQSTQSYPSDESSIYNAVRASSAADDVPRKLCSNNQITQDGLDSGMAANMAMFIPITSESMTHAVDDIEYTAERKAKAPWWHAHMLSDNHSPSTIDRQYTGLSLPNDLESKIDSFDGPQHRKTLSLNDADDNTRRPNWPGSLVSPVNPFLPQYPPPERSPTPPGLPSFGSREAICYSAQFLVHSSTRGDQTQQASQSLTVARPRGRNLASSFRVASYGETLRRVFGFTPSTTPQPRRRPPPVARAEDGTAVQGRFPYRQSGHGMNVARQLDHHPFHRRLLPIAQSDSFTADSAITQNGHFNEHNAKDRYSTQVEPSRSRTQTVSEPHLRNSPGRLPSRFTPAVTSRSQALASAAAVVVALPSAPSHGIQPEQPTNGDGANTQGVGMAGDNPRNANTEEPHDGQPPKRPWMNCWRTVNSYFCCFGERDEYEVAMDRNLSNDSYTTARSWIVDNGAQEACRVSSNAASPGQDQEPRQQRSNPWKSLRRFISQNNLVVDPMLL
ncbi:hypothetical protein ASPWEDRAFT_221510 [Aspergillus wentii DTO 134E9]|uniref:Uncharacterized protein n=1 Tax=Aspergillus wentii DTO 134E9 TaxID=1073089 RepID=A0A1L9S083_ASPWE|nr:uncharacterized protein ASPWEDRAFT_221510 [Aspergillus wentii DTO 134E9]OJJ40594.1 hypothetical protein ASPWEDRAFT_221510 [Aspergillus wentii DTO 134E9]